MESKQLCGLGTFKVIKGRPVDSSFEPSAQRILNHNEQACRQPMRTVLDLG